VGKRLAGEEFLAGHLVINGGTLDVVEESLDEVGGGGEVLEALLVLDADRGASELLGDADPEGRVRLVPGGPVVEVDVGLAAPLGVEQAVEIALIDDSSPRTSRKSPSANARASGRPLSPACEPITLRPP
jgi:hypothetical protein